MESRTLRLTVPEALYRELEEQPDDVRNAALQLAVQAVRDYLRQEAGREMLLSLPEEAYTVQDSPPSNLAEEHDRYLYEDQNEPS